MPEEKRTNRGRPRLGTHTTKVVKFSTSLPPDLYARLMKYCEDDEREKSYAIKKALDPWLSERGY